MLYEVFVQLIVICLPDTTIQSTFEQLGLVGLRSNANHWYGHEMQVVSNLQLYLDRIPHQIHKQASPGEVSLNLRAKQLSCSPSPALCPKSWLLVLFSFPQQTLVCRRPPYRHFHQFRPGLMHLQRQQDRRVRSSSDKSMPLNFFLGLSCLQWIVEFLEMLGIGPGR